MNAWHRLQRWFYDPGVWDMRPLTDDDEIMYWLWPPRDDTGTPMLSILVGKHDRRFWRRMGRKP